MLLTELILSKRGPLGKVWLSAHQERKLSKAQTLGIDVEESVGMSYARLTTWARIYVVTQLTIHRGDPGAR